MPMAPEAIKCLEEAAKINAPECGVDPIEEVREFHLQTTRESYTLLPGEKEPDVEREDVTIQVADGTFQIRVYRPNQTSATKAACDALVYYHGGGWVVGCIESVDPLCAAMAEAIGRIVVSTDYRLSPEYKFPTPIDDCYAAFRWTVDQAALFGIDPSRIAVGGDSAGGNLAAGVALMARDRGETLPSSQVLIYPVTDYYFDTPSYLENAEGTNLTRENMQWYWDQYLADPKDGQSPYASMQKATDLSGLPRALVQTAGYDPLRDEGEIYAKRLSESGVPTQMTRYDGMIHGFIKNFRNWPDAKNAFSEIVAFLK